MTLEKIRRLSAGIPIAAALASAIVVGSAAGASSASVKVSAPNLVTVGKKFAVSVSGHGPKRALVDVYVDTRACAAEDKTELTRPSHGMNEAVDEPVGSSFHKSFKVFTATTKGKLHACAYLHTYANQGLGTQLARSSASFRASR